MVLTLGISFWGVSTAISGECVCGPVGTGTPGYWKNHPNAWPLDEICFTDGITETCISKADALDILAAPVRGDKWRTLFKAYAAAKLNIAIGNCRPFCQFAVPGDINISSVSYWLATNLTLRPVGANSSEWQYSHGELQYWCLDDYNNGLLPGIPSRDALE